jgi:hypothetical protein
MGRRVLGALALASLLLGSGCCSFWERHCQPQGACYPPPACVPQQAGCAAPAGYVAAQPAQGYVPPQQPCTCTCTCR